MINTWEEIDERFNAIKDHKPKATKKLKELGEILSSAYLLDAERASDMWQYLINLNVTDDFSNAKFYIAQVFKKITQNLSSEDAMVFVTMEPERVRLMFLYGYDGGDLNSELNFMVEEFLKLGYVDNAIVVFGYFLEKFDSIDEDFAKMRKGLIWLGQYLQYSLKTENDYQDNIIEFFDNFKKFPYDLVCAYGEIMSALIDQSNINSKEQVEHLLKFCIDWKYGAEFFDLIWLFKSKLSTEDIINFWEEYCDNLEKTDEPPLPSKRSADDIWYNSQIKKWLSEKLIMSDVLLDIYFSGYVWHPFFEEIIRNWIETNSWLNLEKYLSRMLSGIQEDYVFFDFLRTIKYFTDSYFDLEGLTVCDGLGRNNKIIDNKNIHEAAETFAKISADTLGAKYHDQFEQEMKIFIVNSLGNDNVLQNYGLVDATVSKSPEETFFDYILNFKQIYSTNDAGKIDQSYNKLKWDFQSKGKNLAYELACREDVAYSLCKNLWHVPSIKKDMINECVRNENYVRAMELTDLMIDTENYPGFSDCRQDGKWVGYSWEMELRNTFTQIISEVGREISSANSNVSPEMLTAVVSLVNRVKPHLTEETDKRALDAELLKVSRDDKEEELFIKGLIEDVRQYTTFPKPAGSWNVQKSNQISSEMIQSFRTLSENNKPNVLSEILQMLYTAREQLTDINFSRWMTMIANGISKEIALDLFRENLPIFQGWIAEAAPQDILSWGRVLGRSESKSDFDRFFELVSNIYGEVPGLSDCYIEAFSYNININVKFDGNDN